MPSSLDSVKPLGVEDVPAGGTQTYTSPTELDSKTDAVVAAGLHIVGPTASTGDKTVYVDRAAGGLRLTDSNTQRLLSELVNSVSGQPNAHDNQRDLAHFLGGDGPAWGTGYYAVSMSGPLVLSETWYTTSAMTTKIVGKTYTYPASSPLPSSCSTVTYNASGVAVKNCTDVFTYNGPILTSTTRTVSNAS